jgi:hypothetical protein
MFLLKNVMLAVFIFAISIPSLQAEQPGKVVDTIDGSIKTRKETQKKSGEWQTQKERLKSRYYQLKDTKETKQIEINHLQEVVERQEAYIKRINRKIIEMEKIRQQLVPFLLEVISRMEEQIDSDLPFLLDERTTRTGALKAIVNDPEVTMGEKIRRVFEGLRVEMDYGKSVETSKEEIDFKDQRILVKVLRFGRTALLMQTLDDSEIGIFDGNEWIALPGKYRADIDKAIDIAERRRPIEFVNLPVRR